MYFFFFLVHFNVEVKFPREKGVSVYFSYGIRQILGGGGAGVTIYLLVTG